MVAAKPGSWQYHSEVLTDQSPEEVCTNIIREKLLEYLPQEVPYSVTQVTNEPVLRGRCVIRDHRQTDSTHHISLPYFKALHTHFDSTR